MVIFAEEEVSTTSLQHTRRYQLVLRKQGELTPDALGPGRLLKYAGILRLFTSCEVKACDEERNAEIQRMSTAPGVAAGVPPVFVIWAFHCPIAITFRGY